MYDLSDFFILDNMSQEELNRIKQYSYIKECKKDDIIYLESEEGEELYLILSGLFKVFKTSYNGREKTLDLLGEGEFFGLTALFSDGRRASSVKSLTEGKLLTIARERYKDLISNFPDVALKTIGVLSSQLQQANQEIKDLTFKTIEDRLKSTLIELGEKYGSKEDGNIHIKKKFTHQELADIVGTTRETVTKHLSNMQNNNLIVIKDKNIYLKQKLF